jgi:hypothetical protein
MSSVISGNYRQLSADEVVEVAARCADAWKDARIPERQFANTSLELQRYRQGIPCPPFDAFLACLRQLPRQLLNSCPTLLEVGASFGYNREVSRLSAGNKGRGESRIVLRDLPSAADRQARAD